MVTRVDWLLITVIAVGILVIMAGVAIYLFFPTLLFFRAYSEPPQIIGEDKTELDDALKQCVTMCNNIRSAPENREMIWDYCSKYFFLPKSEKISSDLIIKGEGYLSFCRNRAHCFNIVEQPCVVNGEVITPELCLSVMCMHLQDEGFSDEEASREIEKTMQSGWCFLGKGAEVKVGEEIKAIKELTWWEKNFKQPNCSKVYQNPNT